MTLSLTEFQDAFVQALYDPEATALGTLTAQPGFSVYRNTVMKGAVDALQANFPTVERLVGSEWFIAAAAVYARQSPPVDARLVFHGSAFADFLDGFEHAQQMPYLGNVARLDMLWIQVHTAIEEPGIDLPWLASLDPEHLGSLRLRPCAAARWQWFAEQPVYTLWQHNREHRALPEGLDWQGEGALLVRSAGVVRWHALGVGGCAFLDACADGLPLEQAAQRAAGAQPDLNFIELLTRLVSADTFAMTADSITDTPH
jgi:hypothetical protein